MYKEYFKDSYKIILTLIDGKCPCINIYFDIFNYNYIIYGPKDKCVEWLDNYNKIFESFNYSIEYCTTYIKLKFENEIHIIERVDYPMNYILQSMARLDKLEQIVARLIN